MLSGIKKGKRKRKTSTNITSSSQNDPKSSVLADEETRTSSIGGMNNDDATNIYSGKSSGKKDSSSTSSSSSSTKPNAAANRAAAEELRRLLSGSTANVKRDSDLKPTNGTEGVLERLEKRGKISMDTSASNGGESAGRILLMDANGTPGDLQKEDFRNGSRKGKVKQKESYLHSDADKTIAQMVAEERQSQQQGNKSMDEVYARNIARIGSRYKGSDFGQKGPGRSSGADEEDYTGDGGVDMTVFTDASERLTGVAKYNREKSRQIARADTENAITKRCWWWMESGSFRKHMLLSLGDHVSLVMSPSELSLVKSQCILVPVKHSEAFASSEEEVWDELLRFQTSLRSMFHKEGKGVLFCETVLPSKGLWQARIDVIPVPKNIELDAAIFFKSALNEQAEEWGTHTKLFSTKDKGLRRTIPKGFPYFYVEWENGGFAQIIETESFPKNFGLDTIAGMMDIDPVRFNRKKKSHDQDKSAVLDFVGRWKAFDWTLSLDNE